MNATLRMLLKYTAMRVLVGMLAKLNSPPKPPFCMCCGSMENRQDKG
eukprot:CAMPEP_0115516426 /NCGR_PEP_ID=MMETSP0271-20121206/76755_1 /TAXON_ID=71861 /ORGANISM="Scrippsiella trochoidea, Strain CCMP3099" /LENGTH=46 /DNA_ID= /DNA_START= /DNA_END= /DNA_ORIENTATION=